MAPPMTLERLRNNPSLQTQLYLLERLRDALADDAACLGAAVAGSLAADFADSMSDVDLIVYCETGAAAAMRARLSGVAETRAVIYRLNGKHDESSMFEKVVLDDWSSYEIHVIEPSTRMRLKSPFLELINRDGYLSTRISDDKPIGRETVRPYTNGDDGLFWDLFNCMKWLRRGELLFTRQYLQRLGQTLTEQRGRNEA